MIRFGATIRGLLRACTVLVWLLVTRTPAAQTSRVELDEGARRRVFERAHDAYTAKDYVTAHSLYKELWEERPSYDVAAALGQTELKLERYRDAAEHISYSLLHWPPREDLGIRARVLKGFELAGKHVGRLVLEVKPSGARLTIDGKTVGVAPLEGDLFVEPGPHDLSLELEGYRADRQRIELAPGEEHRMHVVLELLPLREAPPPAPNPDAGKNTPLLSPDAPLPQRRPGPRPPWLIAGGALVALSASGGVGLALAANAAAHDITRLRREVGPGGCRGKSSTECSELREAAERKDRTTNLSYACFGIAGASAIATLGYLFWPRAKAPSARLELFWTPGTGAFASVGGTL